MKLKRLFGNKEVRNAGWLIGGRVVQMALSLVVGIITARYLGPSNYGLISYGNAFVAFFTSLCTLGLNSTMVKELMDRPDGQGETLGTAMAMRSVASFLSMAVILGIVAVIDAGEPLTVTVVALCALGLVFRTFETFNFWFQSRYQSKVTAVVTLIAYVATSVYKIVLLIAGRDVRWFALATSFDYVVVALGLWIAYRRHGGARLRVSAGRAGRMLGISYHYILASLMVAIYGQTDKLMLKQMMDEAAVGHYATAVSICTMWTFVLQAIIDSVYPTILQLKKTDQAAYERKNRQLYAIVFYVACGVSVLFLLLGEPVVEILYGKAYLPAAGVLKMVTWYTAFSFLGVARNAWIVSEGCQRYLKYMYGVAAVLNVALNCLLIPLWGAVGAAAASLITQIATSILLPLCFRPMRPNAKMMIDAICLRGLR